MSRINLITTYAFSELSEDAKRTAIQNVSTIDTDYEWWDFICEEAEYLGFKITEFDIYRRTIKTKWSQSAAEVAKKILMEHGPTCTTFLDSSAFLAKWKPLAEEWYEMTGDEENYYEVEDELDEMEKDFENEIEQDYLIMLREQYEYVTSSEAIIETIEANDYQFLENGKLFTC